MQKTNYWWIKGATVLTLAAAPLSLPLLVSAQPPAQNPPPADSTSRENKLMLATVLGQMKRESGQTVLLDRSVPAQDVTPLTEATTSDNIETQLTALAKSLPTGTVWAKVNLPDRGRAYNGDAVADYVLAQAKLFGGAGMPTPAGTMEVMGQKISGDKAQVVSDTLALKPVYILLNPTTRTNGTAGGLNPNWANLTPEQQQAQAQQAAQALLAMSPEQRAGMMQQQMQTMRAMMQNMTPDQRQQMFQSMGQGMGGGARGGFTGRRRGQ